MREALMKKTTSSPKLDDEPNKKEKTWKKTKTAKKIETPKPKAIPKHKKKEKAKSQKSTINKKHLVAYSVTGVVAVLFLFLVIIPSLQGNLHFLIVLSESMKPAINMGDVVVTGRTTPEEIKVGDIITFKQPTDADPDRCVTHRVINITTENNTLYFQTKGDATEDPDMRLTPGEDLIGKVVLSIPYVGYLPHYVKTPLGFIILIILPGSLLIVYEVRNIILTQQETKKKSATKKTASRGKKSKIKNGEKKIDSKKEAPDVSDIRKKVDKLPSKKN